MDICFSLNEINKTATTFLQTIGKRKTIALHGQMGAGKTTFVHAICDVLGVQNSVSSPTFSIINEYTTETNSAIFHIDLYRLKNETEAIAAGVEDCFYSGNTCFIEWPEIAPGILPDDTVHCYLSVKGNNERMLQIKL